VLGLERNGVTPDQGEILVTGAAGGVGSVAISILAKLGYDVIASTGRPEQADYLKSLGASGTIDRAELAEKGRPLGKERWAGAVDTVGSHTLANACATTKYGGTVAACGLAGGFDLPATVMPFILRGVTLDGIDSVYRPKADRLEAWQRLASDLDLQHIEPRPENRWPARCAAGWWSTSTAEAPFSAHRDPRRLVPGPWVASTVSREHAARSTQHAARSTQHAARDGDRHGAHREPFRSPALVVNCRLQARRPARIVSQFGFGSESRTAR
jgi:hypothetical protein